MARIGWLTVVDHFSQSFQLERLGQRGLWLSRRSGWCANIVIITIIRPVIFGLLQHLLNGLHRRGR